MKTREKSRKKSWNGVKRAGTEGETTKSDENRKQLTQAPNCVKTTAKVSYTVNIIPYKPVLTPSFNLIPMISSKTREKTLL